MAKHRRSRFTDGRSNAREKDSNARQQEEYIDQGSCLVNLGRSPFEHEDRKALNEKGRDDLKAL